MATLVTACLLGLAGLVLACGGAWLAVLGGSMFYLPLGLGLLLCTILLLRRDPRALHVFAALLVVTLGWAVWESGFDFWALVPRLAFLAVVGLWMVLPWVVAGLAGRSDALERTRRNGRIVLALVVALATGVAAWSTRSDPYDLAGEFPTAGSAPITEDAVAGSTASDWTAYGGTLSGQRRSTLADVTPENVSKLAVAWIFHTGDKKGAQDPNETTFEVTPIKVADTLYLCTPHNQVIALDAISGAVRWRFDPQIKIDRSSEHLTCRGVAYHDDAAAGARLASAPASAPPAPVVASACAQRIVTSTMDARLMAIDAKTGQVCEGFGEHGVVSLWAGMPHFKAGSYMPTSAPLVTQDLIVIGGAINDNTYIANPSGVIRAFDVHTGRLVWNWDPGRPESTEPLAPGQTYSAGAPNMWAPASADEALGLVYVPMGNKSPDQYGVGRSPEVERYSSSIVALDLKTGKVRWVRQTVHHDLWDRDVPSQPSLVTLTFGGKDVPALVGPTKQGDVYVLDRRTGEPLLPVHEVAAPGGAVPDDTTAPTQPTSELNFVPPRLTEKSMWGATPIDQMICRIEFKRYRYDGRDTPPSLVGSIVYPGNTGVFNWGGVAVDGPRHFVVGATVQLAFIQKMIPRHDDRTPLVSDGVAAFGENFGGKYAAKMGPFLSPLRLPCQQPPWGAVAGADLETGKVIWRHRNGTVRDQIPALPLPFKMGVPSLGGPLITGGGVMFYSGTTDDYLRAYDVSSGRPLWQSRLPAGGQATPMTYRASNGKQYVVVAAGGHASFGTKLGDAVVAYALP
ncbi:MAG: membrane-bound PQQ-dependent dehydrogenase, glucose/quinate/shikimate family [Pseudomonadota bacterium]|nr:membrane-bound PQQ-dependent dehydrogenase, glucose/quinate/shikimate family [Pseudomonadota bacterium]